MKPLSLICLFVLQLTCLYTCRFNSASISIGQVTLNRLHTLGYMAMVDLTGTKIVSNKPIGVISACLCTFDDEGFCGHEAHMTRPVTAYQSQFALTGFKTPDYGGIIKAVAAYDNTKITVSGTTVAYINAGQSYNFTVPPNYVGVLMSDKPVAVSQFGQMYSLSAGIGKPFETNVPAAAEFLTGTSCMFFTPSDTMYNDVNIVTINNIGSSISFDGNALNAPWNQIGSSQFYVAKVDNVAGGAHTIACSNPLGQFTAMVYGFGSDLGYGYVCGLNLGTVMPCVYPQGLFKI